ncbi:hypothetical protein BD410DRAFT_785796 [Rickenella mellea]|uniref:Xylanolytic transcriptional activator regulatory domain-containing protein n=1 Tax=Rickenella mellea TaxID=50990 RepID=A0A4Y7QC79_9AGAM|nr:hypothetical protein BD410DRAFT_785796 [Rickenella mellea]
MDSEQLYSLLLETSERIGQLEEALAAATANFPKPHPLLNRDLLVLKRRVSMISPQPSTREESTVANFGTLSLSGGNGDQSTVSGEKELPNTTPHLEPSKQWPFQTSRVSAYERLADIADTLPSWEQASTLCETYLQQSSWHVNFVRRSQLIDDLLVPIYKYHGLAPATYASSSADDSSSTPRKPIMPDEVACLLIVFAISTLGDLTLEPFNSEGNVYYQQARAILSLETAAESPSVVGVQTLSLMGVYLALSNRPDSLERTFSTFSLASILAASIGLHRDPAHLKLSPRMIYQRRHVFWQLFTVQNQHGLASGRPSVFALRFTDCQLPLNEFPPDDESLDENKIEESFWLWRYRFAKEIMYPINELACSSSPVKYADILKLDLKMRQMDIPKYLQIPPGGSNWEIDGPHTMMQRLTLEMWIQTSMLFIHRSYFAKALLDFPANPMQSQYAHSFISAYQSSLAILKLTRDHYYLCPTYFVRFWMMWKHVFSALMILGTVVIRGPNSSIAPAALAELNLGIEFYKNGAKYAGWAKRAYATLSVIQERASSIYSLSRAGQVSPTTGEQTAVQSRSSPGVMKAEDVWGDELTIFGGPPRATTHWAPSVSVSSSESESSQGSPTSSDYMDTPLLKGDDLVVDSTALSVIRDANPSTQTPTAQVRTHSKSPNNPHSLNQPSSGNTGAVYWSHGQEQTTGTMQAPTTNPSPHYSPATSAEWATPRATEFHAPPQVMQFEPWMYATDSGIPMQVDLEELAMSEIDEQNTGEAWTSFLRASGILNGPTQT